MASGEDEPGEEEDQVRPHGVDVPPWRVIVNGMGRLRLLLCLAAAACGGPDIPAHNGYKTDHAKPWKKAKSLKFDETFTAKAKGDLSYPDMHRSAWYDVELTQQAEIDVFVEATPPGEAVNDNFDLGMEVLDPGFRKLIRKDLEEGDQQGDEKKNAEVKDLPPGHYLIHLYLQSRMDTADFSLRVALKPSPPTVGKSDFPAQVAFVNALPMVPISDDTPKGYKPPTPTIVVHTTHKPVPTVKKEPTPPPVTTLSARIIGVSVVAGGTQITVGRGTSSGAQAGMKGKITGLPNGSFTLASCNERACVATVAATPDQIKGSGQVVLSP
jgi:hypothetical protein